MAGGSFRRGRRQGSVSIFVPGIALGLLAAALTPAFGQKSVRLPNAKVELLTFAALDGWEADDQSAAFNSFLKSCKAILGGTPAARAARPLYGALYDVCQRAMTAGRLNAAAARAFFESNFRPYRIAPAGSEDGFFTGYYETVISGARHKSAEYNVPLYRAPDIVTAFDRTQIEEGALDGRGLEICWVRNPVDAFFAQIQGSARIKLAGGDEMRVGYAARNGLPYTPVGKFLVERGIYSKDEMSMDKIRAFMEANPDEGRELRRKNRSYVFFREVPLGKDEHSGGGQGVELTPLRSLAVDRSIHTYGTPIWIDAKLPIASEKPETPFRHLAIAQDTGTAIIGPARADIFFGSGEEVGRVAGRVKQPGKFVMLVPNGVELSAGDAPMPRTAPLPKPRPTP